MKKIFNYLLLCLLQLAPTNCMHQTSSELITYEYQDNNTGTLKALSIDTFIKNIIAMKIQPPKDVNSQEYKKKILYEKFAEKFSKLPTELIPSVWNGVDQYTIRSSLIASCKLFALNKEHNLAVLSSPENNNSGDLCFWPTLEKIVELNARSAVFCDTSNALAYIHKDKTRELKIIDGSKLPKIVYKTKLDLPNESPVVKSLFPYNHFIVLKHADKNNIYLWNSHQTEDKWSSFNNLFGDGIEAICQYTGYICYGQEDEEMNHTIYIKHSTSFLKHLTLKKFEDQITDLTYSSGLLAGSSYDKTVRMWDVFNTPRCCLLLHHPAPVEVARLSPVGKYLASGTQMPHGNVYIWDLRMNKAFHTISIESTLSPILKNQNPKARPSINYLSFSSANTKLVVQIEDAGNFQLFEIDLAGNLKLLKIEAENFFTKPRED